MKKNMKEKSLLPVPGIIFAVLAQVCVHIASENVWYGMAVTFSLFAIMAAIRSKWTIVSQMFLKKINGHQKISMTIFLYILIWYYYSEKTKL